MKTLNVTDSPQAPLPVGCDLLGVVVNKIAACAQKYKDDYGIEPFDVCLGPKEFDVIYREGRTTNEQPPDWHYKLAPMFYKGMRVRLMQSPGVLVGTLTAKTPNAKPTNRASET